jgi:hypothetical protein
LYIEYPDIKKPIPYCIGIILKEARLEDVLVKQLFYTMLSMYSNDPRNLAIQSPSGEGKNYVIKKVADIFPKEDVFKYVGMTDKSLFHRSGKLVIKNEGTGEYEDVEELGERIDNDIEDKENQIENTKDTNLKQGLKSQIKDLEKEKEDLFRNAKKLIDLSHKCIIFLDTPRPELLNAIMSLLSHDEYEVEYEFVDTNNKNGIKSKSNVLRGWPVVIFAQAVDFSHHKRYAEIQRRFAITNPRMDSDKYKAAIDLIIHKHSVPDFIYQKTVVSDEQKDQAREIVKVLREKIMDISHSITPGHNNVFIPFEAAIRDSVATKKSSDMTIADRIVSYITLLAQVNIENRPFIMFRKKGQAVSQTIPLATFADLKEALFLMQFSNGVRPYVLEWYYDVFLPTYNEKTEADFKASPDGLGNITENRIAITTQQLAEATSNIKNKTLSPRQIRETYLDQLVNQGYIDSVSSQIDKRTDIYYPIITTTSKIIGEKENTYISVQSPNFPSQNYIRSKILALLEYNDDDTLVEIKNNFSLESMLETHYGKPEEVFRKILAENELVKLQPVMQNILYEQRILANKNNFFVKRYVQSPILTEQVSNSITQVEAEKKDINEKCMYSPNLLSQESLSTNTMVAKGEDKEDKGEKYTCYYCNDFKKTNDKKLYQDHVSKDHDLECLPYPSKADIERLKLRPQGKDWEI